ncbi:uncharacterized protein LOC124682078 [Lolium rigidum]|uniref:uncharacterized protein LOC124682078 n=1 Tax=Lolium rigidum TaxID=89674 RepID=UPI001F5C5063|nr:uncharacterized protein LOC124682078 [Lolium rigidum]
MSKQSSFSLLKKLRQEKPGTTRSGRAHIPTRRFGDSDDEGREDGLPPRGRGRRTTSEEVSLSQRRGGGLPPRGRGRGQERTLGQRTPTPSLSDVPSATGTETSEGEEGARGASPEDEEIEEDSEVQQEEIDEEEEAQAEDEDEEELEPQGSSKSIWTRGIAGLPKVPANDDEKTLIKPNNKDNWSFVGTRGRLPNGVLGVLLKKYWPGLYRLKPLDETCRDKKLALKWEDYEAAHDESFGTCANAVITNFWVFYKVPTEDSTKAGQVLVNAARKMVRQQRYDARIVAISHFYAEQGKRVLKKEIVAKGLTLSKEEFMGIAPKWVDGRDDGWAALVDLWVGEDAEFMAQSMKNRENRGKDGTHNAGNRSHDRYKAHQEQVHGKPLTMLGAWKMSHKKTKVDKPGEEQYYGKSGTYLQNYATAFKKLHGEDSHPLEEEVDETVVIVSGLGKRHGRHQILDGVIAPTTTLTQVRASSMSSSQLIPPRPRHGGSRRAFDVSSS